MRQALALVLLVLFAASCGGEPAGSSTESGPRRTTPSETKRPRVVILGDSLTAGLGLPVDEAFPAILQQRIDRTGLNYEVVNAGVSGDTSAGALRRLDWVLSDDVRVLVVAIGANDGLRGLPVSQMKQNLSTIVSTARQRGAAVLVAGMEAPPNVGPEYASAFRQAYRDVAKQEAVPLVPFLLDGVAGQPSLNQADGIHPNAAGARRVAAVVWPALEPLLVRR